MCYHVLNRGNARAEVFHKDADFAAFVDLMAEANERLPLRILAYAQLPNHFHLVLWPRGDGDLSRWMQWLLTSHVRHAEDWAWSSLAWLPTGKRPELLAEWPVARPRHALPVVHEPCGQLWRTPSISTSNRCGASIP